MEITDNVKLSRLADMIKAFDGQMTAGMQNFAADQAARAARLTAIRDRLSKKLGAGDARVANLTKNIATSTAVAQGFQLQARRIARRPPINPADLAVRGRVFDPNGAAVPNVFVRLSNQNSSLKIGPRAETDDSGDFTLAVTTGDLPSPAPPLFLVVETDAGVQIAVSPQAITLQAGSPLYVELVEGSKPPAEAPAHS